PRERTSRCSHPRSEHSSCTLGWSTSSTSTWRRCSSGMGSASTTRPVATSSTSSATATTRPAPSTSASGSRDGGQRGGDGGAAAGAGVDLPAAAGHLQLLAHAGQPEVVEPEMAGDGVGRLGGDEAGAVVADLEGHLPVADPEGHPGVVGPGVLDDVGEGLLGDTVQHHLLGPGEPAGEVGLDGAGDPGLLLEGLGVVA